MVIYADLLMLLNFLVDFLLLIGTNRLSGYPPDPGRAALAALLGALYCGACFAPGFSFLGSFLWRLVCLVLMAGIAFGWNRSTAARGSLFTLLSMALGGIATGMGKGGFLMLVVSAAGVWLLCRLSFRGDAGGRKYLPMRLRHGGKTVQIMALQDTGNTLRDPVTGEGVIVAGAEVAYRLVGLTKEQLNSPLETMSRQPVPGLRLIPYRAVGQSAGMLLALRLESVKLGARQGSALVAFAPESLGMGEAYQALTGGAIS